MDRTPTPIDSRRMGLLALGVCLWLAVNIWAWPTSLSFGDEVGYVGQARIFLEGRIRPISSDPGVWHPAPTGGLMAKYPLFYPAVLAPLMAAAPGAGFIIGIASALALMYLAARVLASWGKDPLWALLILAHPAILVLARTMMADGPIAASVVGAHFALRRGRLGAAAALVALTVVLKPTGPLLAGLLLAGEAVNSRRDLLALRGPAVRRLSWGGAGFLAGLVVVMVLNVLANGSPWYGYNEKPGLVHFGARFLPTSGWAHAKSLLLNPPLLVLGIWPYWRRRDWGALLVVGGLCGLMSIYYFVDWGRNWADSLVLSQRLILPAVAFLMIGYLSVLVEVVDGLLRRLPRGLDLFARKLVPPAIALVPLLVGYQIGKRHRRWQQPMTDALNIVGEITRARGVTEIGLTANAFKGGLLYSGNTVFFPGASASAETPLAEVATRPPVVLCATKNTSYRIRETNFSCEFPGYQKVASVIGSDILVRSDEGGASAP